MMARRITAASITLFCLCASLPNARADLPIGEVFAWGGTNYGQSSVPTNLNKVVSVAAGYYHSLALKSDSTVAVWGQWYSGTTNYTAVTVPPGLTNVAAVAGGLSHSLALKKDGSVIAWGYGYFGQTNLPTGLASVMAIAAGSQHSLGLKSNRTVVAWGSGGSGQTKVPAGLTNVIGIAAGQVHSLALRADGTVVAWGGGNYGQTNVPTALTNAVAIAAGDVHSLALTRNGSVVEWGQFYNGSTYTNISLPAGLTNVVAIAGGGSFSMALRADGTIVIWGYNSSGQLNPPPGLTGVIAIAAGLSHCLALTPVPVILSQSPAEVELAPGASTNLTVTINGGAYQAQWLFDGAAIPGATQLSLTITNFDISKAGSYSLVLSNQFGQARSDFVARLSNSPAIFVDGVEIGGGTTERVNSCVVTMRTSTTQNTNVYYTVDGSAPDFTSALYDGPFTLTNSAVVRAIAYNSAFTSSAASAPVTIEILGTYQLYLNNPGGGSVLVSPPPDSARSYISNTIVSLSATASTGWSFVSWAGDASGTDNVTTVVMDRPRRVTAVFGCALNLATNGNGEILVEPPSSIIPFGSKIRLAAIPDSGSYFFGWAGDAHGFSDPLTVSVTNPPTITALFTTLKSNQVSLTTIVTGNGFVVADPARNVYTNGETVVLMPTPSGGYTFAGWGGDASGNNYPLIEQLDASKLVIANFVQQSLVFQGGTLTLTLAAQDGRTYQLQYSTNLVYSNWQNIGPLLTATNGVVTGTDPDPNDPARFYRLTQQP